MRRSAPARHALLALVSLACGCAGAAGPGEMAAPPSSQPPTTMPPDSSGGPATLESVIAAVRADAARVTGLAAEEIAVASAGHVTWSDGSLGCPAPGMLYTQALVPGYRVQLQAGDQLLDYHASQRGGFVLCPAGRAIEPVDGDLAR